MTEQAIHVYSPQKKDFAVVLGTLDTGTKGNWISRQLVERLGLCPVKLVEGAQFADFQGKTLTAHEHIELTWRGHSAITKEDYFMVAEHGPFDILIGAETSVSTGAITHDDTVLMNNEKTLTPEGTKVQTTQVNAQADSKIAEDKAKADRREKRKAESSTGPKETQPKK